MCEGVKKVPQNILFQKYRKTFVSYFLQIFVILFLHLLTFKTPILKIDNMAELSFHNDNHHQSLLVPYYKKVII